MQYFNTNVQSQSSEQGQTDLCYSVKVYKSNMEKVANLNIVKISEYKYFHNLKYCICGTLPIEIIGHIPSQRIYSQRCYSRRLYK